MRKKAARAKTKVKAKAPKKQAKAYSHFDVVSVSLYRPEQDKLSSLLAKAKEAALSEGKRLPSRSDLIRLAISKLTEKDLSRL